LCWCLASSIGLVKMTIKAHNAQIIALSCYILVRIIKVKAKTINDRYHTRHRSRRQTTQPDAAVNQHILDKYGKNRSLPKPIEDYSKRMKREISHQHLVGRKLIQQLPNHCRLSLAQQAF